MRRIVTLATCVALLGGVASILWVGVFRGAGAGAASSTEGVLLVHRMRDAPGSLRFSGEVRVAWRQQGALHDLTVDVIGDHGSIEVHSGDARVLDHGRRTYFGDELGWSSATVGPDPERVPDPDHRWALRVRDGHEVAGRPTQLVEAVRGDGTPVQRLYLDLDTDLLLRRDVLDDRGRVRRSVQFLDLTIADGPALEAPSGMRARKSAPLDGVPSVYAAPDEPAGCVLVVRARHEEGIELLYSDGLFAVTVHQQRGALDWDALPKGGVVTEVGGNAARRYAQPGVDVIVWERGGTVFTIVSDAPPDVIDGMAAEFVPRRGTVEKVVDFVLGPFGWD